MIERDADGEPPGMHEYVPSSGQSRFGRGRLQGISARFTTLPSSIASIDLRVNYVEEYLSACWKSISFT
jgi:hypothetical protein